MEIIVKLQIPNYEVVGNDLLERVLDHKLRWREHFFSLILRSEHINE